MHLERSRRWLLSIASLALALGLPGAAIQATPMIHEAGWTLTRTDLVSNVNAAHFNPVDGRLYVAVTTHASVDGGLYRINADGSTTRLAVAERPVGVVVDHATGDVFYSVSGAGQIFRVAFGTSGNPDLWVSGFHSGDDDPVGMAFAPSNYTGAHLLPGQAVVVDEGSNGPDEVWGWNFGSQEGEFVIHEDTAGNPSPLVQAVDVAVSATDIWLADVIGQAIWKVDVTGGVTQLATSVPLGRVAAIAVDPLTGDLVVLDKTSDEVLRVDPVTGAVSVMFSGFSFIDCCTEFAGLDFSPDGSMLFVTDRGDGAVYTFSVPEPGLLLLGLLGLAAFGWRREQSGSKASSA